MKVWSSLFLGRDEVAHEVLELPGGRAVVYTRRAPERELHGESNEDGVAIAGLANDACVLAVADGAGGHDRGEEASTAALHALVDALAQAAEGEVVLRESVLRGFEAANASVRGLPGSGASTLCVAEIRDGRLRAYHVGDSGAVVVGQRGRRRLVTVAHSPPALAVEAGLLDEDDALHDEDRHVVLNMLGDEEMRIEMSAPIALNPRDTLLLGSDGLFDNLRIDEIVATIRKGPLVDASRTLAAAATTRMRAPRPGEPTKPDDISYVLYRPGPART